MTEHEPARSRSTLLPAARRTLAGQGVFLSLMFLMCWAAELALGLALDHDHFGLLSVSGAFGAAVFPWAAGALLSFISGPRGRLVGPLACIGALAVLTAAEHI